MNIETVNEIITSLGSAGELSIKETKVMALAKAYKQLAAENTYLLNGAARELNTSWMFHKTMLGAQAALVCLAHGYQAAAREWLEGTTDEAGAEIPDDISVGELHEWFDSQMISNDGNSGFLTRAEAEEAIREACPATDSIVAGIKAEAKSHDLNAFISHYSAELDTHIANGGDQFDERSVRLRGVIVGARMFREKLRDEEKVQALREGAK